MPVFFCKFYYGGLMLYILKGGAGVPCTPSFDVVDLSVARYGHFFVTSFLPVLSL